tara:strand:+ start:80 stop:673 length:594 start_codon:yes stop_codon:yes gene_type:complete
MSAFSDVGSINALSSMMSDAQQAQAEREEQNVKNNQIGTVNIITPAEKKRIEQEKQLQLENDIKNGKVKVKDPNAIWDEEEIDQTDPDFIDDGREVPEYNIIYKQHVGAEDVYLGMGNTTPSTISAGYLVVHIDFPGQKMKDLDLKVEKQKIVAQSPKHRLCTYLPHEVDDQKGNAKWDGKKDRLSITLPIVRGGLF